MGEVGDLGVAGEGVHDAVDVLRRQPIVVGHLDALAGGVDKQGLAVRLVLFQHHDAGGDAGAEEQVAGQLDDAVDEVVVDQVLADLLLRTAPVQDAGEADDGGGAVGRQPAEAVHDKGQICLALGGQHPGGGKAGIVDQQGVVVPSPLDGVGGIGDDQLKRLIIPVLGVGQGILTSNIKLVKADVVEEHVDTAQVVGGDIDLLAVEAVADSVTAQHLHSLQQQRAGAAGGVYKDVIFDTSPVAGKVYKNSENRRKQGVSCDFRCICRCSICPIRAQLRFV